MGVKARFGFGGLRGNFGRERERGGDGVCRFLLLSNGTMKGSYNVEHAWSIQSLIVMEGRFLRKSHKGSVYRHCCIFGMLAERVSFLTHQHHFSIQSNQVIGSSFPPFF